MPHAEHKFSLHLTGLAKSLRDAATPAEKKLWCCFQNLRKSHGLRFRRQQPIGPYIADFYCAAHSCVIEIDGLSHETKQEKDSVREAFLKNRGVSVLRFTESETLQNPESVIETILRELKIVTPPPTPPSRGGE